MEYVIIGACIVVAIAGGIVLYVKNKRTKNELGNTAVVVSKTSSSKLQASEVANDLVIQIGILPADAISDETKLVEITDSKVLAHINNLVPGLAQAGNAANNATQAVKANGEVLYRAIIPAGAKLTDSKAMEGAVRGIYHQQSLLEILYKISDLRYALHLGTVSREQCMALLPTYSKQVSDTQARLTAWHEGTAERLGIEADESRRKRAGFDRVIHFIPGLFNDDLNFRGIEERTASMITAQKAGHVCTHKIDKSELYAEDVQLISKDGKIYYLPVSKAE